VLVEFSFGEETSVSRGFAADLSVIGVDVDNLALSSRGAVVGVEALPMSLEVEAMESPEPPDDEDLEFRGGGTGACPGLLPLELGKAAFFMEVEHGAHSFLTSRIDDAPGFSIMFVGGATRPSWSLLSSTGK
jgi:hypothetical protein